MKSMTGFGRSKRGRSNGVRNETIGPSAKQLKRSACADVSVRSVNGRFLEIRVHLPREWSELEPELRSLIQERVSRGTVDLHVNRLKTSTAHIKVNVDRELAHEWMLALKSLAKEVGLKPSGIPFDAMIRAPDILKIESDDGLSSADREFALSAAREAVEALDLEREREGREIQQELLELLSALESTVRKIGHVAELQPDELRERLKQRLERLEQSGIVGAGSDDSRFHQEVAMLIDRGDIREEIARLAAHMRVYRDLVSGVDAQPRPEKGAPKVLVARQPIGKTLDFYAQELLREVNTVGSKSSRADLTRLVVEAKTLVEKIREQVQNVE